MWVCHRARHRLCATGRGGSIHNQYTAGRETTHVWDGDDSLNAFIYGGRWMCAWATEQSANVWERHQVSHSGLWCDNPTSYQQAVCPQAVFGASKTADISQGIEFIYIFNIDRLENCVGLGQFCLKEWHSAPRTTRHAWLDGDKELYKTGTFQVHRDNTEATGPSCSVNTSLSLSPV